MATYSTKTLLVLLAPLLLSGCVSVTPVGPLNPPSGFVSKAVSRPVFLNEVIVSDITLDAEGQKNAGKVLTGEIKRYMDKAGYFSIMKEYPTKIEVQDLQLQFEFSSLQASRSPHPGYFPGAIFTLTIWIWVGGPIYTDELNIVGKLTVLNANNQTIATAQRQYFGDQNVSFFDPEYYGGIGSDKLQKIVKGLLDDAVAQL